MHELGPVLLVVLGVCLAGLAAGRTGVPSPVLLVVGGLAVAALPGEATLHLDPEIVLALVLPPLLYSAALDASLTAFRANLRPIVLLSVGLVLFTAAVVGAVAHVVVPDLPWAAALAFGAIVAPPDAVAAIAIGRRIGMPARLQTVIEGEGLLNDATALVLYTAAVAAVVSGGFSPAAATGRLALSVVGGLVVGLAVAGVIALVRLRLDEPLVENALSLATPFLAYAPAEAVHGSGVLAVVVCGLVLGHASPRLLSSRSRLQTGPVWRVVVFLLEGGVFLLIGLQLPEIVRGLADRHAGELLLAAAAVLLAVLLSRPLYILPLAYLPRRLSLEGRQDAAPRWRVMAALSWTGMRGVVSLAAAFALPLATDDGRPFPQRDLLLFLVFVIVVGTLLLQGLTYARVLRALGLRPDRQGVLLAQAAAQQAAVGAALRRLDEDVQRDPSTTPVAEQLRRLAQTRSNARWERLGEVSDRPQPAGQTPTATWRRLRVLMMDAERTELLRLRDEGRLPDEAMRELQRQLDLEEAALTA